MSQSSEDPKPKLDGALAGRLSKEAVERKQRSMERLNQEGVPVIKDLPVIESSEEAEKISVEVIVQRTIAVIIAAVKGEGAEQESVDFLVKKYNAGKFFSPEEAEFIKQANPSRKDRIKFSWRYECAWVLLWSLGYVDSLTKPGDLRCEETGWNSAGS